MNNQRLACLLLGAWLSGTLFVAALAVGTFRITDRLLMTPTLPAAAKAMETLGALDSRYLLRHQAGEFNRAIVEGWGLAQLGLGVLLLCLLLFGTLADKKTLALSLLMVLFVAANQFAVLPGVIGLGRAVEFADSTRFPSQRRQLSAMSGMFLTLEVVKVLTGCGLAFILLVGRPDRKRRGRRTSDLNPIDHSDYSRIDR